MMISRFMSWTTIFITLVFTSLALAQGGLSDRDLEELFQNSPSLPEVHQRELNSAVLNWWQTAIRELLGADERVTDREHSVVMAGQNELRLTVHFLTKDARKVVKVCRHIVNVRYTESRSYFNQETFRITPTEVLRNSTFECRYPTGR